MEGRPRSSEEFLTMRIVLNVLGAVVLVIVNGLAGLTGDFVLQIAVAALSALGIVVGGVLQLREIRAKRSERLEEMVPGGVKRVRELDREEAGVAPEAPGSLATLHRSTGDEYLTRDVDEQLDSALVSALRDEEARLIVLMGPSKAGKSRTLFEAMRRQLPDAEWVAPADVDALDALMKPGGMPRLTGSTAVLWLDDLELYVRVGLRGMGPGVLKRLSEDDRRWIVLATAGGKGITQAGEVSKFSVPMEDLLRHATKTRLPAKLSADERQRLRDYAPDAAEQITKDGIGEYMIAGEELIRKLDSGSHHHGNPPCPQGQAVANTAIDWQRAGIVDPIPRSVLREAYPNYLPDHADPSDTGFEEGLAWARKPLYSSVALVSGREELQPYDLVVTSVPETRAIDQTAWLCFLKAADPEQAFALGTLAFWRSQGETEIDWEALSEQAGRKALEAEDPGQRGYAFSNLGVLLAQRGDLRGAVDAYNQAFELGVVDSQVNLGHLLLERGKKREAREAFERADKHGSAAGSYELGCLMLDVGDDFADAEVVLLRAEERGHEGAVIRLARAYEERKEPDKAEAANRRAADEVGSVVGAVGLAVYLEERGKLGEAFEAWERADERGSALGAYKVGMHLADLGNRNGAKAAFQRGAERGDHDSAHNLATFYYEERNLDEAEKWFAVADELGHATSAYNYAILLANKGKLEEAEAAFRRAAERGHPKAASTARAIRRGELEVNEG
jgi:tetratricopeptide (TPR) repeat protein